MIFKNLNLKFFKFLIQQKIKFLNLKINKARIISIATNPTISI